LDLSGSGKASGGKLFAKSLAKNFKSLTSFKQHLIGAVVSTAGRSKALRELYPKFASSLESLRTFLERKVLKKIFNVN